MDEEDIWYGYITINKAVYYIKDAYMVYRELGSIEIGDVLDITDLGKLRVVNVFRDKTRYNNLIYHEVGITCQYISSQTVVSLAKKGV